MSSTSLTPTATSTSTSTSLTTTATSPENERPHRKKEDGRVEKQAGTKTRSARRSSTRAAAADDPRGAPRRRPQPSGFGTASGHQPTAKAKGHKIPPPSSSIYTALRAPFRLWVFFRLKVRHSCNFAYFICVQRPDQDVTDPTLINKALLLYSQYPDCYLSFLLVLRLPAGNRPSWSG